MATLTADPYVPAVRAFNRFYTTRIGVLAEGLLDTPYSLTEARVLYELAQRDRTEVADLRRALRLDAGYLSRILAKLETAGLVARGRSPADARRQVAHLTGTGRDEFGTLDARSAREAHRLLANLGDRDLRRLVGAMATIEAVLSATPRAGAPVTLRPPEPGDYGWIVARHGALYAQEYGWDSSFEALVAGIVANYVNQHVPGREAAWIAELDGVPVGCILCVRGPSGDRVAQLRLLLVEPAARGLGVGGRLIDACLRFARDAGYESITLWTNDVLTQARRLYERAGFTLTDQAPHHSFGHDLVGQHWHRKLRLAE